MIDLDWHDFYDIGVDFIDAEHKQILAIMRGIRGAILADNYDECSLLSNEMIVAAKEHFKHEEEYLEKLEYPELNEHISYHHELVVQANKVKEICEGYEKSHNLMECFEAMEKFLIDDIFHGDISFKSYLQHKGIIKRVF